MLITTQRCITIIYIWANRKLVRRLTNKGYKVALKLIDPLPDTKPRNTLHRASYEQLPELSHLPGDQKKQSKTNKLQ